MRGSSALEHRSKSALGFTLLEVVVALVIASLALVGLFRAGSGGLFASDTAARVDEAVERAQSHLAAFGRTGSVAPGEMEGDDGGGYRWRVRVAPVGTEPVVAQGQPAAARTLYSVQVAISWGTGRHTRSVSLETRRLGAGAGAAGAE
jgi:general secretion pathway protein I